MGEAIFYVLVAIAIIGWGAYTAKKEEIVLHDPHADDFNKDIWED